MRFEGSRHDKGKINVHVDVVDPFVDDSAPGPGVLISAPGDGYPIYLDENHAAALALALQAAVAEIQARAVSR